MPMYLIWYLFNYIVVWHQFVLFGKLRIYIDLVMMNVFIFIILRSVTCVPLCLGVTWNRIVLIKEMYKINAANKDWEYRVELVCKQYSHPSDFDVYVSARLYVNDIMQCRRYKWLV